MRFLAEHPDDEKFNADFERLFAPGVLVGSWEPDITNWRQWLTRVSELLSVGLPVNMLRRRNST